MIFPTFTKKVLLVQAVLGALFFSSFGAGVDFSSLVAEAQAVPEIWMTWKASSYVPPEFEGKAMPVDGTFVTASFEVVDGDRFVSMAGYEIYWYLNDEFIKGGMGEQQVSFRAPTRGNHQLRVKVNNYNGVTLVKTITVPAVRPEAVIAAPYPRDRFYSSRIQVQAIPYFFNTTNPNSLNFAWTVNGQKPSSVENISFLDIDLGGAATDGYELSVKLSVSAPGNFLLSGSDTKILTFQK